MRKYIGIHNPFIICIMKYSKKKKEENEGNKIMQYKLRKLPMYYYVYSIMRNIRILLLNNVNAIIFGLCNNMKHIVCLHTQATKQLASYL